MTLIVALISTAAFAQSGANASLSGTVTDKDGGIVPGATVVVKNKGTGESVTTVTNGQGAWSFPSLNVATYTVTVTLSGFKTVTHEDVRLLAGTSANLKTVLEVGSLSETVEVRANTELIRTTETKVSSTVSTELIQNLPIVTRNTLNFVTFLPGVETTGTARASTVMGLPQTAINLTIDGVSVSNQLQSTDGFYAMVFPKLDAIEEVTMTGAGTDAAGAAQGTVQVKFVTKSGTNVYKGTGYEFWRNKAFNTNYFFNKVNGLDRNAITLHQFGFSEGGPIVIPGLFDGRGKAFFFFNFEEFYQPTEITRTRTILTPEAQTGIFRYQTTGGNVSVDLLALAAANGQLASTDPTIMALLAKMRAATTTTGNVLTPANQTLFQTLSYIYQAPSNRVELSPTQRVDVNLNPHHRLSGTYYWQRIKSDPDILNNAEPRFPGFVNKGVQNSYRTTGSMALRSTLGAGVVNEVVMGWQWSPVQFNPNVLKSDFDDQGGFSLAMPTASNNNGLITAATTSRNRQPRNTPTWNIDDNYSWLKGSHSLTFGGTFSHVKNVQNSEDAVSSIQLGLDTTNDPARTLFSTTFFPGNPSAATLNQARDLYALLTGRVTAVNGAARLNDAGTEYVYLGNLHQEASMAEFGAYAQDSWKVSPTLTLNYGVRWEAQLPFQPITSNWSMSTLTDLCGPSGTGNGPGGRDCNLFNPGVFGNPTQVPTYVPYSPGNPGYNTSYTNFAPNVGAAWRPNVRDGWLNKLLGDPEQAVLRGTFSVSFNRPRMDEFTSLFGNNPGGTVAGGANRSTAAGAFPIVGAGETWPVLFRDPSRLGAPAYNHTPTFPITASITGGNDINVFDPNIRIPYTQTWSLGLGRSIGKNMAIDIRYTGNRNLNAWDTENWNLENIKENGFLDEFKLAQANLQANIAAGRGSTFAYQGAGTGTSPLPTYLAYFSAVPTAQAGNSALYTSTNFTNATFVNQLNTRQTANNATQVFNAASSLWTGSSGTLRSNSFAAGLPTNFFVLNPLVDDANVTRNVPGSYYNSVTVELRRRFSRGLLVQGNYTYAIRYAAQTQQSDFHRDFEYFRSTQSPPHTFKVLWSYQIPVGRGKRFGSNMSSWMDGVLGGWEWSGTGRVQQNLVRFRGVIVGMTAKDVQDNFKIRFSQDANGRTTVFSMPQDIIDETRKAYDTSATSATGYGSNGAPSGRYLAPAGGNGCYYIYIGDCGEKEYYFHMPLFTRFDMTLKKNFALGGKRSFALQFDILNVFDNVNFNHNFNPGGSWQVTSAYTDVNGTYDPGGRLGQVVFRINW
jgi:Carboxypeptidase regulatory-like domain/TonB dependent receptor-like, beta-barrel